MDEKIKKERDFKIEFKEKISKKYKHQCSWKNCEKKSISSHSISKSNLKLISNRDIIHPTFDIVKGSFNPEIIPNDINMKFKKIGLDKASTFNGFCTQDDNSLFKSIDNNGIQTRKDIFLQLYRTATKFYFNEKMVEESELKIYKKEYYSNKNFEENKEINLKKILSYFETFIEEISEIALEEKEIFNLDPELKNMLIIYRKVKLSLPMALENHVILKNNNLFYNSLFLVIPSKNYLNILILCHHQALNLYMTHLESNIKILNLIESIMMYNSEFFLSPKEYSLWSKEKIKFLEDDYYFFQERNFLEEYKISIFDDIRQELCRTLPKHIQEHEMKKINNIYTSKIPLDIRLSTMRYKTESERISKK